MERNYLRTGR